ncbi:UNVERIFIED_CONTAM: hypothetical protein RMT77_008356 [Armadillidium vulgare]
MQAYISFIFVFASIKHIAGKNVLLMIADDAGLESPIYGNFQIKTPNINRLGKRSVIFDSAFTSVSSCSPSRSTILTGLPSHQNGMYGLHNGYHHFNCFSNIHSLPGILSKNNITTGIIGKKHIGPENVFRFDFAETEENNSIMQVGRNITKIKLLVRNFLGSVSGNNFFLYVAFHDPHRCGHTHPQYGQFCEKFGNGQEGMGLIPDWVPETYSPESVNVPYFIPDTETVKNEIANQYTTISRLDQGIGLVIKELEDFGFLNDTLIIYSSDNGIPFPNGRTNAYEPGMIEPLLLSSPFHPESHGKYSTSLASLLDITPTILDWFSIQYPEYKIFPNYERVNLTGKSLLSYLKNTFEGEEEYIYFSHTMHEATMYYPIRTIRNERFKLIHNLNSGVPFPIDQDFYLSPTFQEILNKTLHNETLHWYKTLKDYYFRPEWELFDLKYDRMEKYNVAELKSYRKVFDKLKSKLFEWQKNTSDPWLCSPHGVLQDSGPHKLDHECFPLYNS